VAFRVASFGRRCGGKSVRQPGVERPLRRGRPNLHRFANRRGAAANTDAANTDGAERRGAHAKRSIDADAEWRALEPPVAFLAQQGADRVVALNVGRRFGHGAPLRAKRFEGTAHLSREAA
jgi:hypothetical protein